jgi:hypothetical protein
VGAFIPPPGQPSPKMDPNFKSTSLPAITRFAWTDIQPPSPLYVLRDDVLLLQAINGQNLANDQVNFNYRFLRVPEVQGGQPSDLGQPGGGRGVVDYGIIDTGVDVLPVTAFGQTVNAKRTLGEGFLLSLAASCSNATQRGQLFARAVLIRGGALFGNSAQLLFADYVTGFQAAGWPGGRALNSAEGPGSVQSLQVANPAPGNDWIMNVPGTTRRKVLSFGSTFTASATVATRNINVILDDGVASHILWQDDVNVGVTASQVVSVNGTQTNTPTGVITTELFVVLPPGLSMAPLWRLRSNTAAIQGTDQWSAIWIAIEDLIDQT